MAKGQAKRLTPLEALVMDCVWTLDQATVQQVQARLEPVKPMAYNTALTVMRILREKGFLTSERQGRRDVYRACVTRRQMAHSSLGEILERFFAGSRLALVSQLLESEDLDAEEIRAIRREVDEKLRLQAAGKAAG